MGMMIELAAADGFRLAAYRADPAGVPRGSVVVAQEIFGVNSHIKSVCDGFAADGYLAMAPALFDRVRRARADGLPHGPAEQRLQGRQPIGPGAVVIEYERYRTARPHTQRGPAHRDFAACDTRRSRR